MTHFFFRNQFTAMGFVLALFFSVSVSHAQVDSDTLGGQFPGSTVLDLSFSPYHVVSDLHLQSGDTLTIEPGVVLLVGRSLSITINGSIIAKGTPDDMIRFVPENEGDLWFGMTVRHLPPDTTQAVEFEYCEFVQANVGLTLETNTNYYNGDVTGRVHRSLFYDCHVGILTHHPGNYEIHNCVLKNRVYDMQHNYCKADVRNCLFLPHENYNKQGMYLLSLLNYLDVTHEYNCYDISDGEGEWINFIRLQMVQGGDWYVLDLDPTEFAAEAHLLEDPAWYPDPILSPLIDAGDPATQDPDFTIADIGMYWAAGILAPVQIGDLLPTDWVAGYDWNSLVHLNAYPSPEWTMLEQPGGLQFHQQGRNLMVFTWAAEDQEAGSFPLRLAGQNVIDDIIYYDTLNAVLDFQLNEPPHLTFLEPCLGDDCLSGDPVIIDHLSAGVQFRLDLMIEDPNAERLGAAHETRIAWEINEQIIDTLALDSLSIEIALDTVAVDLRFTFFDNLTSRVQEISVDPRYTLLEGDLEGVLNSAVSGAVYLVGPVRVPYGKELLVEAGTRIVFKDPTPDEWIFEVDGRVEFAGNEDFPIRFISTAASNDDVDNRPHLMRISSQSTTSSLRYVNFENLATAVQLEHLGGDAPFPVEHCRFSGCRYGLVALETPLQLRSNIFEIPRDSLQLGSVLCYIAESEGNDIRNNLFVNSQIGLQLVNAEALVANNTFHTIPAYRPPPNDTLTHWPNIEHSGYGRFQCLSSQVDLRNNLFHWKTEISGASHVVSNQAFFLTLTENMLATRQHAIWLDDLSTVDASYNWYHCQDGVVMTSDSTMQLDMTMQLALNDVSLLNFNSQNRFGIAGVDTTMSFALYENSPLVNAGDPALDWLDAFDGTLNDIGWRGGPYATDVVYSPLAGWNGGSGVDDIEPMPSVLTLGKAWPNPFNPTTQLEIELGEAGHLTFVIYNLLGQAVAHLANDELDAGRYRFVFNAGYLASGTYFARATLGEHVQTQKLLLLK